MFSLWADQDGLTTVEYALLLMLVVLAAVASWQVLGTTTANSADMATNGFAE